MNPPQTVFPNRSRLSSLLGKKWDKIKTFRSLSQRGVSGYFSATQRPDLPPIFSSKRTPVMVMPRSAALHMS